MSKLDYVTIAIVGICIMAILFLVYKMTNVFKGGKATDKTELTVDSLNAEDDDVYDYEIDENVDSTEAKANGNAATDNSSTTKPTTSTAAEKTESSASNAPAEDDVEEAVKTATGSNSSSGNSATDGTEKATYANGKYMVIAGSFAQKAFAEQHVKKLTKLGYNNAHVEIFDRGKYAVVLVDRFGNMAEAERLVKKLSADSVKSYVKVKS